jgi:hypothetical protein
VCKTKILRKILDKDIDDSLFTTNNYDLIRRNRLTDGCGGVLIFIKKNLVRSKTEITIESSNEIINFIITLPENKKIGIIAAYRPPYRQNVDIASLTKLMSLLISMIQLLTILLLLEI